MSAVRILKAYPILSSNGLPTVEVFVQLQSGAQAHAAAPKGQSCGIFERRDLRDNDGVRVAKALQLFEYIVAPTIIGRLSEDHLDIDSQLHTMLHDGALLPANITLPISIALALAHSKEINQPFAHYIGGIAHRGPAPIPCINMINGGVHGKNPALFQEYLVLPQGADSFAQGISWAIDVCTSLKNLLIAKDMFAGVGDEGGFCIKSSDPLLPLRFLEEAISKSQLDDTKVALGIDCAASGYKKKDGYHNFPGCTGVKTAGHIRDFLLDITDKYDLAYIEDPFADNDLAAWRDFDVEAHIIGDDLFATDVKRLSKLSHDVATNGIMIKPNQIGTLSETIKTVSHARLLGYNTVFAHRSSDTEDTWIAELALGFQADLVKFGNIVRGERTAKYNTLLRSFSVHSL